MANLFPEEDYEEEDELVAEDLEEEVTGYHPGYYYDFETGDYKKNGSNDVVLAAGVDSWKQWCIKCLNTQKGSCAAYYELGVDYESILQHEERDYVESKLVNAISEALMNDPYKRTVGVDNVEFIWGVDSLSANVTVRGIENVTIDITTVIGGV